jgi:hypothetical protein
MVFANNNNSNNDKAVYSASGKTGESYTLGAIQTRVALKMVGVRTHLTAFRHNHYDPPE